MLQFGQNTQRNTIAASSGLLFLHSPLRFGGLLSSFSKNEVQTRSMHINKWRESVFCHGSNVCIVIDLAIIPACSAVGPNRWEASRIDGEAMGRVCRLLPFRVFISFFSFFHFIHSSIPQLCLRRPVRP